MKLVAAPLRYLDAAVAYDDPSVFLAGGITDCPDWQADIIAKLADTPNGVLFNPRQPNFNVGNTDAAADQIIWEFRHLRMADAVLFWFPASGTVTQPIAMFELGAWSMTGKPLFVGADPGYVRRADVLAQLTLARPDIEVRASLDALASDIRRWLPAPDPFAEEMVDKVIGLVPDPFDGLTGPEAVGADPTRSTRPEGPIP